jgi:hypothetical protein
MAAVTWYHMKEQQPQTMKLFGTAIAGIMIATSLLPAYAADDDRRNQSNNTNTNTNNNTNTNDNSNTNTINSTGGSSTSTSTQTTSNNLGGSTNTLVNQGTVYYPDWINVSPSQSSVSMSSASCQGPTINGAVQTLETTPWNDEYGVQGSIGISIPLGGQKDCYAVQTSLRKRALFENAANTAMMCSQLEKMNVKFDDARFPELSSCLPPVVSTVK